MVSPRTVEVHDTRPGAGKNAQQARILLIEDDAHVRASTASLLELAEHSVTAVATSAQGVNLLSREHYDVVLLDLTLADGDGFPVLQYVRDQGLLLPVIVISGDANISAAVSALRYGASDFVLKPYDPDLLLRSVAKAVRRRGAAEPETSTAHSAPSGWYQYLIDHSVDFAYTLDAHGCFTFLNANAERLLGCARQDLLGKHYTEVVHPSDLNRAKFVFNERRTGKRASQEVELRLQPQHANGGNGKQASAPVTVLLSACGVYQATDSDRRLVGTYGFAKDITAHKNAEGRVYFHAYHDSLTRLPNRLLFKDRLLLAQANAKRGRHRLAVMFIDLDRFKLVNDSQGHAVGDQLLQAVAARMSKSVREGDTLSRFGGDEFVLLLPQIDELQAPINAARKLLDVLARPFNFGQQEHFIGASIGIAIYPDDGENGDLLIKNADAAMYEAKARGRNTFTFYAAMRHDFNGSSLPLEQEMQRAVVRNEFELYYQPVLSTDDGRIVTMEALLRWNHPTRGLLTARDFLPAAEEARLMAPIGEWSLKHACSQMAAWKQAGMGSFGIAVNLSARQLLHAEFATRLRHLMDAVSLPAEIVSFEVAESAVRADFEAATRAIRAISETGAGVAVDNFGVAGLPLNILGTLPLTALKLDRAYIQDVATGAKNLLVTKTMIMIAKSLGLRMIAEGVEDYAQLDFLRAQGCDGWQGFLFGKPMSAESATRLLIARQNNAG